MQIFEENLRVIEKHNEEAKLGLHSYTMGVNQFTDLTNEEYMKTFGGCERSQSGHEPSLKGAEKFVGSGLKVEASSSLNWVEQVKYPPT